MDNRDYTTATPKAPEDNLTVLLREYHGAKMAYDDACHGAQNALNRREQTAQILHKLSEEVSNAVNRGLADPTVPQDVCAETPRRTIGNGGFAQR